MSLFNKNKKVTLIKKDSIYYLNDKQINPKYFLLKKATLTSEFAYLIVVADKVYNLRSDSWLKKQTDKENDREIVDELNASFDIYQPIVLENCFSAILPKKLEKNEIYYYDNHFYSPQLHYDYSLNNIEVIFLERLTSYTRTFDLTIVDKNLQRICFTCIDRKKFKQKIHSIFVNHEIVETGPDPVCWTDAIKDFKNGISWENVYHVDTEDDNSEEWQPGETEDETETEDEYYEELPVLSESKKRKLDKEWEDKALMDSNEDYDNWEKKQKVI